MNSVLLPDRPRHPSSLISLVIFAMAVSLMVWLKLSLFPEHYITLGYALPLLLCLWHRDRRLLWAMASAFAVMSALKALFIVPGHGQSERFEIMQWLMQLTNVGVVAATVHIILNLTERLQAKNQELLAANGELATRGDEIARQNAELQAQSEELVQQNEELQQQGEELGHQNHELQRQAEKLERQSEELQRRAEEVQVVNQELNHKEGMLTTLLDCLAGAKDEPHMLEQVCRTLLELVGPFGMVAAVLEREGDNLVLLTQAGSVKLSEARRPAARSFAAIVMEHGRTAFVDDLSARPDLMVPQPDTDHFRSVLATPLRLYDKPIGVVKIYSFEARKWSSQHFRIIEWVAGQCSLALSIMRLREELGMINSRLEEQVRQRTGHLREMVNELEHFSYTITHDMRAPLRAIRGYIGTLEELIGNRLDSETRECLNRVARSAQRMDRLITDALSYSRAVQTELTLGAVDTAGLLRGIIESYPNLQPPKAHIHIDGEIPNVLANEAGLTQCFSNLLENAAKFVRPGTIAEVRIRAETRDGVVRILFEDNGIGIPEAFRPRLFKMFQRANKVYEGTGVGLALVRKVAERMKGGVGVEFGPGPGSRFWLELRVARASRVQFELPNEAAISSESPNGDGRGLTVFLPNPVSTAGISRGA